MNDTDFISIILPVCNGERFLRFAVNSVLAQNFQHFELILINDGSTDQTATIIKQYNDRRIRAYHHQKRQGLVPTLNEGIKRSNGTLIARIDADDVWHPEKLTKQLSFLRTHPAVGLCGSSYVQIDECGNVLAEIDLPTDPEDIFYTLLYRNCIVHSSVVFRKEIFDRVGPYDLRWRHIEDYDLWLKFAKESQIAILSDHLVSYRMHADAISDKYYQEQQRSCLKRGKEAHAFFGFEFHQGVATALKENSFFFPNENSFLSNLQAFHESIRVRSPSYFDAKAISRFLDGKLAQVSGELNKYKFLKTWMLDVFHVYDPGKIGFYAAGSLAKALIDFLEHQLGIKPAIIFDQFPKRASVQDHAIVHPSQVGEYDIDCIIITSERHHVAIEKSLNALRNEKGIAILNPFKQKEMRPNAQRAWF